MITILGSARFSQDHVNYQKAYQISTALSQKGYAILTGSGLGVMEAASKGAADSNGMALGCYIKSLESVNTYLHKKGGFYSFSSRQKALIDQSDAIIIFPGGFGTLAELMDCLVLIQNKQKSGSLFLIDCSFWEPLIHFFRETLLQNNKTIDAADLNSIFVTDSIEDVLTKIPSVGK